MSVFVGTVCVEYHDFVFPVLWFWLCRFCFFSYAVTPPRPVTAPPPSTSSFGLVWWTRRWQCSEELILQYPWHQNLISYRHKSSNFLTVRVFIPGQNFCGVSPSLGGTCHHHVVFPNPHRACCYCGVAYFTRWSILLLWCGIFHLVVHAVTVFRLLQCLVNSR